MEGVAIHLLNAFVTFNRSENMTEAARSLGITQPALSKQLKALVAQLPGEVFTFSGRKKVLTPFGRELQTRLEARLGNLQQLIDYSWHLHTDGESASVTIAARPGILDRVAKQMKFAGRLVFKGLSNEEVVSQVLRLEAQIGIVHKVPDSYELVAKPLFREEFYLAVPKKLLPKKFELGRLLFSELKEIPCVGFSVDDKVLKAVCGFTTFEMKNLKMRRAIANYRDLADMVDMQMGWGVLPAYLGISENKNWIFPVSAKSAEARSFYVIYRREFGAKTWLEELVSELKSCF